MMESVFKKKSAKSCWIIFSVSVILLTWCSSSFAENIIGQDEIISIPSVEFLPEADYGSYGSVFNFFFTLELLVALVALLFRWIGRILRS